MKVMNTLIALLIVLSTLLMSVNAEELTDYFFEVSLDLETGESSVTEKDIISNQDYSDTLIKVTKTTDGITSDIYTGFLSGYDNGKWKNVDFSNNEPLLIIDLHTDEYFWIVPIQNTENQSVKMSLSGNMMSVSSELSVASQIKINGVNVGENGLRIIDNANMSCLFSVSNNSSSNRKITVLLATYTEDGKLYNVSQYDIDVDGGETTDTEITYQFDAEKEYTGKIMFWDSMTNLIPLKTTINFSQQSGVNAYYYNSDNRLLQIDKINGTSMIFTYDNMGNLLSRTIRK